MLGHIEKLTASLERVRVAPCLSLMMRFVQQILPEFDIYSDTYQAIRWIGRNNGKPGRKGKRENLLTHASQAPSRETEGVAAEIIAEEIWSEVCYLFGLLPVQPIQDVGAPLEQRFGRLVFR